MAQKINKIKNHTFKRGRTIPQHWEWDSNSKSAELARLEDGGEQRGVRIHASECCTAGLTQSIAVKAGSWYRVEADVSCQLQAPASPDYADNHCDEALLERGLVLSVTPPVATEEPTVWTPAITRTRGTITLQTWYEVPEDTRQITIMIGIRSAIGEATVHDVRAMEILPPDMVGHALSLPQPAFSHDAHREVSRVNVCSASAETRMLGLLLCTHFGHERVSLTTPDALRADRVDADALILPDAKLPRGIKSLRSLMRLAEESIIIVSLPAFKSLAPKDLSIRMIDQEDDPIHAKVMFAEFATHGFGLHDVFPFAWGGKTSGSYAQRQFRNTNAFKSFCKKHGLQVLLNSMCDADGTSDRPIALFKRTSNGGLFVLDLDPLEVAESSFGASNLAMHLLLALLGEAQCGIGQFCVPAEEEGRFRGIIREMPIRFAHVQVHDEDVPDEDVEEQLVTLGQADMTYGLSLAPKPAIILRSGILSGDMESIYGTWVWFKHLIRMPPHTCPYVEQLATRFRIAWLPCAASWESPYGFIGSRAPSGAELEIDTEHDQVAAMIDVISRPLQRARVVMHGKCELYDRMQEHLSRLAKAFIPGTGLAFTAPPGGLLGDRAAYDWRPPTVPVEVVADASAFGARGHGDIISNGGNPIRIEVPGSNADFPACSIHRTEFTATLLELVIGLLYGLIAVNRSLRPVQFDGFAPIEPGKALIVDDPALLEKALAS